MLSLITLPLTHLISIWTDLILILLPCNLNAHNYCNYAAEGNSSSTAGRPKFRASWQGWPLAGWTHSHLRAGSSWEHRSSPCPTLSGYLGLIPVMSLRPFSGALGTHRGVSYGLSEPTPCILWLTPPPAAARAQPGCLYSASTHTLHTSQRHPTLEGARCQQSP